MHIRIIKDLHKLLPVRGIDFPTWVIRWYNPMFTPLGLFAKSQHKIHLKQFFAVFFLCVKPFKKVPKRRDRTRLIIQGGKNNPLNKFCGFQTCIKICILTLLENHSQHFVAMKAVINLPWQVIKTAKPPFPHDSALQPSVKFFLTSNEGLYCRTTSYISASKWKEGRYLEVNET